MAREEVGRACAWARSSQSTVPGHRHVREKCRRTRAHRWGDHDHGRRRLGVEKGRHHDFAEERLGCVPDTLGWGSSLCNWG
jgi:hypothetical protein